MIFKIRLLINQFYYKAKKKRNQFVLKLFSFWLKKVVWLIK